MGLKKFYTGKEASAELGLSMDGLANLVRDGKLNEFRDGGVLNYKAEDIQTLLDASIEKEIRETRELEGDGFPIDPDLDCKVETKAEINAEAARAESGNDTTAAQEQARNEYVAHLLELTGKLAIKKFVPNEIVPLHMELMSILFAMESEVWALAQPNERYVRIGVKHDGNLETVPEGNDSDGDDSDSKTD